MGCRREDKSRIYRWSYLTTWVRIFQCAPSDDVACPAGVNRIVSLLALDPEHTSDVDWVVGRGLQRVRRVKTSSHIHAKLEEIKTRPDRAIPDRDGQGDVGRFRYGRMKV